MANERILTGVKQLDANLKTLERKAANRAARSGLAKGARLAVRAMKKEVPSRLKSVRASLGSSVKKSRGGVTEAKAGAAVGKRSKKQAARSTSAGVGISRDNVHWFILGTGPRTQATTGRFTGDMPSHPVVRDAMAKQGGAVRKAIIEGTSKAIEREIKKLSRR